LLDLSKEEVVEMRRQIWTTYTNLNHWFDSWERFIVTYGFAADMMSKRSTKEQISAALSDSGVNNSKTDEKRGKRYL
jgi:hypothetical protein